MTIYTREQLMRELAIISVGDVQSRRVLYLNKFQQMHMQDTPNYLLTIFISSLPNFHGIYLNLKQHTETFDGAPAPP